LPLTIRASTIDELSNLSDLCFRSKAVWGYDEEFMDAFRGELSFEPRDLELTPAVAEHDGKPRAAFKNADFAIAAGRAAEPPIRKITPTSLEKWPNRLQKIG
jgi:hypothetical protein